MNKWQIGDRVFHNQVEFECGISLNKISDILIDDVLYSTEDYDGYRENHKKDDLVNIDWMQREIEASKKEKKDD